MMLISARAATTHQAWWYAVTRSSGDPGVPMIATKSATPIAMVACRIMVITPEPVANDEGGRDAVPTPMRVGKVSPTPMPVHIIPMMTTAMFGLAPIIVAQKSGPAAKNKAPAVVTVADPNLLISFLAKRSDVTGTSNGPGAMARPVFSADHSHAVCCQRAIDSSMAPKAAP